MIIFLYNLFISFSKSLITHFSFGSEKYKKWQQNQKNIATQYAGIPKGQIVFFIASSGEFEQAKPVIECLKSQPNPPKIIVSFFSPTGHEALEDHPFIDYAIYTPLDTKKNTEEFIQSLKPKAAVFVKYELWLNMMTELHKQTIPCVLFSAVFTKNHFVFQWYGKPWLKCLQSFKTIYVQAKESKNLLAQHSVSSIIAGDTRIDRSLELPKEKFSDPLFENLSPNTYKIILGSVWDKDLELFKSIKEWLTENNFQLIIAPHELKPSFLNQIENDFETIRYSSEKSTSSSNILVDKIGLLKHLYRYGDIAFIGGGFGKGIHNTLEPASYSLPVIFGPNYKKFLEASAFIEVGAGFSVKTAEELKEVLKKLIVKNGFKEAGKKAKMYLQDHQGASKIVCSAIKEIS